MFLTLTTTYSNLGPSWQCCKTETSWKMSKGLRRTSSWKNCRTSWTSCPSISSWNCRQSIHRIKLFLTNQFATLPHNPNQQLHKFILIIVINQFFQCMNPLMDYQLHKQVGLPMQLNNLSPGSTQHNKTRSRWWSHSWWLPTNGCANVLLMKNSLIQKLEEHMVEYLECNSWYNGYVWEDSTWKLVMLSIFLFLFYNSPRRHLWNCEMLF